jgi:polyhydroxyalkanoate synthase
MKRPHARPTHRSALDRLVRASVGRLTRGISPVALTSAYLDWLLHLLLSPGMQAELLKTAMKQSARLTVFTQRALTNPEAEPFVEPSPEDSRFQDRNGENGLTTSITNPSS